MRKAEREGFAAMLVGMTEEDNPYQPSDEGTDYDLWLDGYYTPQKKTKTVKKRRAEE